MRKSGGLGSFTPDPMPMMRKSTGLGGFKPTLAPVQSGIDLANLAGDDDFNSPEDGFQQQVFMKPPWSCASHISVADSTVQYADPGQTLIFLDWDDTIFPTTEIFDNWKLDMFNASRDSQLSEAQLEALERWRKAADEYVKMACALSDRCVVVTNSRRPWVDSCVERFVPSLAPLLNREPGGLKVLYADEELKAEKAKVLATQHAQSLRRGSGRRRSQTGWCGSCCAGGIVKTVTKCCSDLMRDETGESDEQMSRVEKGKLLTAAKLAAMKRVAQDFYSKYEGQTWKNIISIGDMRYEIDAVREVKSLRRQSVLGEAPARERLKTKAILVPSEPTIGGLTSTLTISRMLLQTYVQHDGDIDLDLRDGSNPMHAIGTALGLPELAATELPEASVGDDDEVMSQVVMALHESLTAHH